MTTGSTLEYNKDYFLPHPNDEVPDISELSSDISDDTNLEYFFSKYLASVKHGKPNIRLAKNLKAIIDIIQIKHMVEDARTLTHHSGERTMKFIIPVGKLTETEQKSFLQKLKEKLTRKQND